MKFTSVRALERHLADATPEQYSDLYMVISKESFDRKECVDRLLKAIGNKEGVDCVSLDGEHLRMEVLLEELNAFSLFAKKRVIVIQQAEKLLKPVTTALESYFEKPNSAICLIVSIASVNHATHFYKKAEKAGIIVEIAEEKPWEKEKSTREWLISKVTAADKQIDSQAVQMMLKQMGTDHSLLNQELEKLYCYVGERREITVRDVGAVCTNVNVENGWQLGEAIFRSDITSALRISKALLAEGTSFLSLIRQVRSQFQTDFQVCSILANGGNASNVTQQFPYMRGQILERRLQSAQTYGMNRFKKAMLCIDSLETMAKNSQADHEFLAELLITKLV